MNNPGFIYFFEITKLPTVISSLIKAQKRTILIEIVRFRINYFDHGFRADTTSANLIPSFPSSWLNLHQMQKRYPLPQ